MADPRKVIDDELYAHFVTFSCDRRRRLLDEDVPKRILLGQLNAQLTTSSARCVGFVVMPDHVHAVIWFSEVGRLSRFVHGWKRLSSYRIKHWYRDHDSSYLQGFELSERFWTRKYYSFEIYSKKKLDEKLTYMHNNPVRAGLVNRPTDWPWSSARWYEDGRSVGVPISSIE